MKRDTYRKAKAVVEATEKEPDLFGDLTEEMNATGKVDPAFQELRRRTGKPTRRQRRAAGQHRATEEEVNGALERAQALQGDWERLGGLEQLVAGWSR